MSDVSMFIDGKDHRPVGDEWFDSYDPFLGAPWARVARGRAVDVDHAVSSAEAALREGTWSAISASARGELLFRLADAIADNAERLAEIEVRDNGKLMTEMLGQLQYIPQWFRYYGGLADKVEGRVLPLDKPGYFAYTKRVPVGVTAVITPWNSPLFLLAWKLAPALAAGCTVVAKPSEFTSASTVELARVLHGAGLPSGVFNVVTGLGAEAGAPLVEHASVSKVSFTGSDGAGRVVGAAAGRGLKRVSLELGGKSPNIVFPDAPLDDVVNGVASGIFAAAGQTCIAGSRLLVHASVHDELVERVVALARSAKLGDPRSAETQVGPISTEPQYSKVLAYFDIARDEGVTIAAGGGPAKGDHLGSGLFIEPTILTGVSNAMRVAQEEIFGPVLSVITFDEEQEAVRLANESPFGLGAGVWTADMARAFRMAEAIEAGTVWVNTYRAVSVMAPFGGMKDSGLGRENGAEAIEEYLETKTTWINIGAEVANPFVMR